MNIIEAAMSGAKSSCELMENLLEKSAGLGDIFPSFAFEDLRKTRIESRPAESFAPDSLSQQAPLLRHAMRQSRRQGLATISRGRVCFSKTALRTELRKISASFPSGCILDAALTSAAEGRAPAAIKAPTQLVASLSLAMSAVNAHSSS